MRTDFTGKDLTALRRALVLTREAFASHLNLDPKYFRKAERYEDDSIPYNKEFSLLYDKLLEAVPHMILIRFSHMRDVQQILQHIASKLECIDNDIKRTKETPTREKTPAVSPSSKERMSTEKKTLRSGGVDKRSAT